MYKNIYVPLDNSEHSNRAMYTSLSLGQAFDAKLTGSHVYAARMHDYRFRQMEFTLPEEYLEEAEISRQRKIHDSLITMGLELISDCYLNDMEKLAADMDLNFEKRMMDGKHSTEILKDVHDKEKDFDLVVLGALGIGRTRDAQLGSVAQRVAREASSDVWVVKHVPKKDDPEKDTILVGLDGSPQSFGALMTAMDLARKFNKKVELISVYDPYLHYAVFKGIVDVLTEPAAKIFRFEEQNQLHEEIIDTGLAEIYLSHLNVGEEVADQEGMEVTKTLLDGKVFQKVLDHVRKIDPWLLVLGRIGIHRDEEETGLGSNTDNLLRLVPCDVLLTTRLHTPELDVKAEASIHWTQEADARLERAPEAVRGMAKTAILRMALEKGHSVVTSDLVTEAMDRFMPKNSQAQTKKLAEALAYEKVRKAEGLAICKKCSTVALVANPVRCTACGGVDFEQVSKEKLNQIAAEEGGMVEETTYDGRKLRWTKESRKALKVLTDAYQRRRAKARIEKAARRQRMETVTVDFAKRFIEEEGGVLYEMDENAEAAQPTPQQAAGSREIVPETPDLEDDENLREVTPEQLAAEEAAAAEQPVETMNIIARDRTGSALLSPFDWTEAAAARILRVPKGFMRDRTQNRVEELATQRELQLIEIGLVEEGVEHGLLQMKEMIAGAAAAAGKPMPEGLDMAPPEAPPVAPPVKLDVPEDLPQAPGVPAGVCPVAHDQLAAEVAAEQAAKDEQMKAAGGKCPVDHEAMAKAEAPASSPEPVRAAPSNGGCPVDHSKADLSQVDHSKVTHDLDADKSMVALNEVSVMSELDVERRRMQELGEA